MLFSLEKLFKSQLEIIIEAGVQQGVDKRVDIPQPCQEVTDKWRRFYHLQTHQELLYKEREPADNEGPEDEAKDPSCFPLP